jgi:PAS domain S-box-containing protein
VAPKDVRNDLRNELLALLVDNVQDYAIFLLDPSGTVVTWNKGAERIKGYTAEDILGRHFSTFYTPDALARDHPAHELEVAVEEGRFEEEGWRVRKDGSRFWANVVITAVYDRQGKHIGFGKVTRDLTERRELQQDLMRSNEDLLRFAALAAHDLAEPLRTVGGFADLIQRRHADQLPDEVSGLFDQIKNGVGRMDALIQSLLGYARAGARAAGGTAVALEPVAHALLGDLRASVEESGAAVSIEVPEDATVLADAHGVALVLQNLISNAIKFSGPAAPEIVISTVREGSSWRTVVLDRCVGVEPTEAERIFQPLERAQTTGERGNGLGLATCRRIVEHHGGAIGVQPRAGGGSEFWFTLPAVDPGDAA